MKPTARWHVYEVRPRKDQHAFDLISDALPFGRLWYGGTNANRGRSRHHMQEDDGLRTALL